MDQTPNIDQNTIIQCFMHIHNPNSTPLLRKQADTYLIQTQKCITQLMKSLISIFINTQNNQQIRLQSLIYLSNVIKRNWTNKRLQKTQPQLPQLKRSIAVELLNNMQRQKIFQRSLFDIVGYLVKVQYPHAFNQFTHYVLMKLNGIEVNQDNVRIFKALREIVLELAERKGFANQKAFDQGPLKILAALGPITEGLRVEICKPGNLDIRMVKLSKYCDQMLIGLLRIAPYAYLDDQNFMIYIRHMCQKLQTLLSSHKDQTNQNKDLLQKDIKSLIYQLGCLQQTNPCMLAPILSDYLTTLFYILPKPQLFTKPQTIKYSLLSLRKVIKQFTYYSQAHMYQKTITSQAKSNNYLQLRNIGYQVYKEYITEDTIEGLFNFMISNIMSMKEKGNQCGFIYGIDENYQKGAEKELTVHYCGVLLVEALVERFPEKMLKLTYESTQLCLSSNFQSGSQQTFLNFLSILSILPKNVKKQHFSSLSSFPILQILQYIHSSTSPKLHQKFPSLLYGWLQIFTNQQVSQLIQVLLQYILEGSRNNNMQILLYCCYSLNRVILLRSAAVNCAYILNRVFPIAIKIFEICDNPQILWPLINLISSLITKTQFNTQLIVQSIEQNSLNSLINNQSEILVEALCEMFRTFLCIIPRNQPAIAVFKLIYCFLNVHLRKTEASYFDKCITLWYYAIRQFSSQNHCNQQYTQLFQTHYLKTLHKKTPTLIYILQQYMLLNLLSSSLSSYLSIVLQSYKQAQFIQCSPQSSPQSIQQGTQLKIATLSFHITLITKYTIEQINCEQMLYMLIKEFCREVGINGGKVNGTLRNSLLAIVNRYVMMYPDYLFQFLKQKMDIYGSAFYMYYFRNMDYLTSRTAIKINALALISLLPKIPQHLSQTPTQILPCLATALKTIIPQLQLKQKQLSPIPSNQGRVQNSPIIRFSQSILSQRKQSIRKQTTYDQIDIKKYFISQFGALVNAGIGFGDVVDAMDRDIGVGWGKRLENVCQ